MQLVTVSRRFHAHDVARDQLIEQCDAAADTLIDMEDGVLLDSTVSVDLGQNSVVVDVTIAGDSLDDADALGNDYIDKAITAAVGAPPLGANHQSKSFEQTGKAAKLVPA